MTSPVRRTADRLATASGKFSRRPLCASSAPAKGTGAQRWEDGREPALGLGFEPAHGVFEAPGGRVRRRHVAIAPAGRKISSAIICRYSMRAVASRGRL